MRSARGARADASPACACSKRSIRFRNLRHLSPNRPVQTLLLVAKRGKPEAAPLAMEIRRLHPERTLLAEEHLARELGWPVEGPDEELAKRADLVISLGGD